MGLVVLPEALLIAALCIGAEAALADGSEPFVPFWPKGAKIYFIEPNDHASIAGKVIVKFALSSVAVPSASADDPATGANPYLLVDSELPLAYQFGAALPADAHHMALNASVPNLVLDLQPGPHTLQLLVADDTRVPHYPPLMSQRINILVK
jgi:hypothetical protein